MNFKKGDRVTLPDALGGAVVRFTILSGAVDMRIADVPDLITYLRSCVADSQ